MLDNKFVVVVSIKVRQWLFCSLQYFNLEIMLQYRVAEKSQDTIHVFWVAFSYDVFHSSPFSYDPSW